MEILRTPDDRFDRLPGWSFQPTYVELTGGLRVASYDPGDPGGRIVLLLHGEPTWSYVYRSMFQPLLEAGLRPIAVDLVGFGSDKPASPEDYTYRSHTDWLREAVFDRLGLTGITLFAHDWGGLLGLRSTPDLPIGPVVNGASLRDLRTDEIAAYDAPFPDATYKSGARRFPALVPSPSTTRQHRRTPSWSWGSCAVRLPPGSLRDSDA